MKPLKLFLLQSLAISCLLMVSCQKERPTGKYIPPGAIDEIDHAIVYNGNLIVSGNFSTICGNAKLVAVWNGSQWDSMGNNLNSNICSFSIYNSNLVAGGNFNKYIQRISGTPPNYIAQWNGTIWNSLGGGMGNSYPGNGEVYGTTIYNGNLIAVGEFDSAGTIPAKCVAVWNGTSWDSLGPGFQPTSANPQPVAYAVQVYKGNLIVGGFINKSGSNSLSGIAQWNGSSWQTLGGGISGANSGVGEMLVYDSNLIVVGNFTLAGTVPVNNIAQWNGTNWSALTALENYTISPVIYNGNLIVSTDSSIAYWSGSGTPVVFGKCERAMPSYGTPHMNALCIYNGNLIVGGFFDYVNGIPAKRIAQWDGTKWSAL